MSILSPGKAIKRLERTRALLRHARAVQGRTGKSVASQLSEIVRLRLGPGLLSPVHYYQFELYDDERFSWERKREYASWPEERLGGRVNDIEWRGVSWDKMALYTYLRGSGLRYPEVVAYYHTGGRRYGHGRCLRTPEEAGDYLRTEMEYPFFGKPSAWAFGRGASLVEGYDAATDRLRLARGETMPVAEYVRQYVEPNADRNGSVASRRSYVFQRLIRQHPALLPIVGERVTTLRIVVLVHDDGPRLFRAAWRVPAGGNIIDNFEGGALGNVIAVIDRDRGVVQHALLGKGGGGGVALDLSGVSVPTEVHPDTGARIAGLRLPCWDEAVELALTGARTFPRIRYQSWDIALAEGGPVVVELNYHGDMRQRGDRGFNDPEMQAFMAAYARK